jgi:hypothetical protein
MTATLSSANLWSIWSGESGQARTRFFAAAVPVAYWDRLYRDLGARVVPLFEVDNLDEARAELARTAVEVFGEPDSDGTWTWLTFRAPDGNIYGLGARLG